MTDDEIRKQNRENLLSRIEQVEWHPDGNLGLLDECAEEIKRLRDELKTRPCR